MREIRVPGDKSITQRALILSSLATGESRLRGLLAGADPQSTARVLRELGVPVPGLPEDGAEIRVRGVGLRGLAQPRGVLDFGNSGTGARLMLGVLAGQPMTTTVTGDESLRSRPMGRVTTPLSHMGAQFRELGDSDRFPLEVTGGGLKGLDYDSPVASAQVKSALLLAGVVSESFVLVSEPRRSRDHTERVLTLAGASVVSHAAAGRWRVELRDPPDRLRPLDLDVPGDFSSAAFFVVLALLGGVEDGLRIEGVGLNPTRTGLLEVLSRMGGRVEAEADPVSDEGEPLGAIVVSPSDLSATEVTEREVPAMIDEFPILAVAAARAEGTTRITGASELRVKESDRIRALVDNLRAVGVRVEELDDGMEIEGAGRPLTGRVVSHGDHRIAMAFGVLGALPGNRIEVEGASVVDVSFPGFWELLASLRGPSETLRGPRPTEGIHGDPRPEHPRGLVITLDGPAGSGKTTTARELASCLGYRHLDSGALYRALTFALLEEGIPEERWSALGPDQLAELGVRVEPGTASVDIFRGDRALGSELRSSEVTRHVPVVAGLRAVREWLLDRQRALGAYGGLVADGRDMGTVVFPNADIKVFLVASLDERARRRLLQDSGSDPSPDEVSIEAEAIARRDEQDSGRELSPLRRPEGALEIDTTSLTFEQQVARILSRVESLTAP